ncbi:MAG: extracellular solute-binding protein [Gemmatimonadetes bacterium]|nr:extracellular solute-binding protein [Gemmatimonadota bacterium]
MPVVVGCSSDPAPGVDAAPEAASVTELAVAAATEEPAIWYDSSPDDQGRRVVAAFAERFPGATVRHVRLVGGLDIAARMVLEARTSGEAADVATLAAEQARGLYEREVLAEIDWGGFDVASDMVATPYALATATAVFVLLYNPEVVPRPPGSWDELLDPEWAGRMGSWVSPHALVQLVPVWGEVRAADYASRFAAQEPVLFRSTFSLAQSIASGDLPAGVGVWHAAKPLMESGAPVAVTRLSPAPVSTLYTVVASGASSPNTARLFASWLASPQGAMAYDAATGRGSMWVPGTETAAFLAGIETSEFPFSQGEAASEWMARFGAEVRGARAVRP